MFPNACHIKTSEIHLLSPGLTRITWGGFIYPRSFITYPIHLSLPPVQGWEAAGCRAPSHLPLTQHSFSNPGLFTTTWSRLSPCTKGSPTHTWGIFDKKHSNLTPSLSQLCASIKLEVSTELDPMKAYIYLQPFLSFWAQVSPTCPALVTDPARDRQVWAREADLGFLVWVCWACFSWGCDKQWWSSCWK